MPQAVLGVAFSFGIPMAFAAATGSVPALAWWLLVGNLFWVLAYDTEYAMVDRDDDLKIGIRTSAITLGRFDVAGVMLFYAAFLAIWAALGAGLGLHWPYFAGPRRAGAIAAWHYADPHAHARRLLSRLPAQPLGRLRRIRGRGGGLRAALIGLFVPAQGYNRAPRARSGCARRPPRRWRCAA